MHTKQNKQDSHISSISPPFVMYWQKQFKQRVNRKYTQQKSRENSGSRKQMNPAL